MTARVEIITADKKDVLLVPEQAVHEDEKGPYVLVAGGTGPVAGGDAGNLRLERRPIVRGESDGDFVEVKEGLREGERVALSLPPERTR